MCQGGGLQEVVQNWIQMKPQTTPVGSDEPQISLLDLPILKCWPKDGGRFITLPNVHTRDPETGARNVGMYRMQIFDERTTACTGRCTRSARVTAKFTTNAASDAGRGHARRRSRAYTFAATAPLPDGLDEFLFAGFLRKKSVELVKCKTIDLEVPADADFVFEGFVEPGEMRPEGPFGDHTGFYTAVEDYPVFHLTAITIGGRGLSDDDRRHCRRWRIFTWATRPCGFSCRSSK